MSIFHELKEKIVFPRNWKDNLIAHKKYEKLYKKNPTELIYSNIYRIQSREQIEKKKTRLKSILVFFMLQNILIYY